MKPNHNTPLKPIPFRIRIGVTGHRTLPDGEEIASRVREALERIPELFDGETRQALREAPGKSVPIAYTIVTPLAEGADRLVAQEVLKLPHSRLKAVLPLATEDYLEDFGTPESREEFEQLLARDRNPTLLQECTLKVKSNDPDLKEKRREAYRRVGRYVVDNCDLLITLWDGKEARGTGGTGEIVEYAESQNRPRIHIQTTGDLGITLLPGSDSETEPDQPGQLSVRAIAGLSQFNRVHIKKAVEQESIGELYRELFEKEECGRLISEETKAVIKKELLPFHVRASRSAKYNQRLHLRAGSLVYAFSALAVLAITSSVLVRDWSPYSQVTELILLLAILFLALLCRRKSTQSTWIERRFLVERIRSAAFMFACGTETTPISVPAYMGTAHRLDDWMVMAFNEIWNRLPPLSRFGNETIPALRDFAGQLWVGRQLEFHRRKKERARKIGGRLERLGLIVFILAVVAAALHFLPLFLGTHGHGSWMEGLVTFAAIILPAVGAALGGIRSHGEYHRLEKQSESMARELKKLGRRLDQVSTRAELDSELQETDRLMLRETQEWMVIMRVKVVETP